MSQFDIKIQEPCHENWNAMTQKAQGRFCSSCAKDVVDFTTMSDMEVTSFFTDYTGSICGRFKTSQLEPQKKISYFTLPDYTKKFVRAFALVFIMFTTFEMQAQTYSHDELMGDLVYSPVTAVQLSGIVFGPDGTSIKNASLQLYKNGAKVGQWVTDNNGLYKISVERGDYQLRIAKLGYALFTKDVSVTMEKTLGDFELILSTAPEPRVMGRIRMGKPAIRKAD